MPTPKLFTRQYKTEGGKIYMFFRYFDDHNNNYEYQVYELVIAKKAARTLGALDINEDSDAELNTRRMCDWVWENVNPTE